MKKKKDTVKKLKSKALEKAATKMIQDADKRNRLKEIGKNFKINL